MTALRHETYVGTWITAVLNGKFKESVFPTQHSCCSHADKLAASACLRRHIAIRQEVGKMHLLHGTQHSHAGKACLTHGGRLSKREETVFGCTPDHAHPMQVTLNNGLLMPSTGFGTAGLGEQTDEAVHEALLAGYTLFDTAQVSFYSYNHNQHG